MNMENAIAKVCDDLKATLLAKNESYGNAVGDPIKIFSKSDKFEQMNVRIDDKLSRIARGSEYQGDDTEMDLAGYLLLKRAIKIVQGDDDVRKS